jgi:hypothetical protein
VSLNKNDFSEISITIRESNMTELAHLVTKKNSSARSMNYQQELKRLLSISAQQVGVAKIAEISTTGGMSAVKADISNESVRTKLEQHRVDSIRSKLSYVRNFDLLDEQVPLGDEHSASGRQTQEWLAEKKESESRWIKVGMIAAANAAVFAFLAWGFPLLPPQAAPDAPSTDLQQLKAMSTDLAAVRQSVDQLAAQVVTGQEQMKRDITKLQDILEKIVELPATEQGILENILDKISASQPRPAAASAHKPASSTSLPPAPWAVR